MVIFTAEEKKSPLIDRANPFLATIKERWLLTKDGSSKKTYHLSLDLQGAALSFKPGDSIGVYAQNDPLLVEKHLLALKASGDEPILDTRSNQTFTLKDFLFTKANLARLTSSFLKTILAHSDLPYSHLLQPENKLLLTSFLTENEPLDLLEQCKSPLPLQEICNQLAPLLPRFYSVASSPKMHPNEVHLTVALTTFSHKEEIRYGVASHFLCNLAQENTPIPIYVQPAHSFSLPDPEKPIIMIGPGTGIAPFRAFLQEREMQQSTGKNWLFFGERTRAHDYLYEEYWSELCQKETLRLSLAFSRDQSEKIYVQHKMHQEAKELWKWLQEGAYFYVCGDAQYMAKDVEAMLQRIAKEQGGFSDEEAKAYIKSLRAQKRYLTDVY